MGNLKLMSHFEKAMWHIKRIKETSEIDIVRDFIYDMDRKVADEKQREERKDWYEVEVNKDVFIGQKVMLNQDKVPYRWRRKVLEIRDKLGTIVRVNTKRVSVRFIGPNRTWLIPPTYLLAEKVVEKE